MASQTSKFRSEILQADFDDICATWNFTEPLNNGNIENIFNPLLKKLYHKLISQWEMNHSSNETKQLFIKYWKQNYEDSHQSPYHCDQWLQILKQDTPNEQYSIEQCIHSFNKSVVSPVMDHLNNTFEYIQTQTNDKDDIEALPLGWIQLNDNDGDYYYNFLTTEQQRNLPIDPNRPQLKKAKPGSYPYPAMIHQFRINNGSQSTREHIADGVTLFNKILQITDTNKLQKELSNHTNWGLLVDEIYTNLNPSDSKAMFQTLKQITQHLFEDDNRFRRIYIDNEKIQKRILIHRGGYEFLFGVGFKKVSKAKLVCDTPDFDIVAAAFSAVNTKYVMIKKMMVGVDDDDVKCDQSMKDDLLGLIKKIKVFNGLYDGNILKEMHGISDDLLPTEKEMKNGIFCMNTFVDTLSDVSSYISSLNRPNISSFAEWDIDVIMKWIESLENGRFVKYVDILKKGFVSDEISAALLPTISSNHLRVQPFNITNFADRNSLIQHFRSLNNGKQCLNEGNQGNETEYI